MQASNRFRRSLEIVLLSCQSGFVLFFFIINILVVALLGATALVFHCFHVHRIPSRSTFLGLATIDLLQIIVTTASVIDHLSPPESATFDAAPPLALSFLIPYLLLLIVSAAYFMRSAFYGPPACRLPQQLRTTLQHNPVARSALSARARNHQQNWNQEQNCDQQGRFRIKQRLRDVQLLEDVDARQICHTTSWKERFISWKQSLSDFCVSKPSKDVFNESSRRYEVRSSALILVDDEEYIEVSVEEFMKHNGMNYNKQDSSESNRSLEFIPATPLDLEEIEQMAPRSEMSPSFLKEMNEFNELNELNEFVEVASSSGGSRAAETGEKGNKEEENEEQKKEKEEKEDSLIRVVCRRRPHTPRLTFHKITPIQIGGTFVERSPEILWSPSDGRSLNEPKPSTLSSDGYATPIACMRYAGRSTTETIGEQASSDTEFSIVKQVNSNSFNLSSNRDDLSHTSSPVGVEGVRLNRKSKKSDSLTHLSFPPCSPTDETDDSDDADDIEETDEMDEMDEMEEMEEMDEAVRVRRGSTTGRFRRGKKAFQFNRRLRAFYKLDNFSRVNKMKQLSQQMEQTPNRVVTQKAISLPSNEWETTRDFS